MMMVGGWNGGEKERIMTEKLGGLIFFQFLHLIFFMLKPWNPPLFIGVEDGYFVFNSAKSWLLIQLGRILTIGSKWPSWSNKVTAGRGWLGWLLWGGATAAVASIGQNKPHWGIVRCQVIVYLQVLPKLVERWSIKCLGKVAP